MKRVVIIGGGIAGMAIADALAEKKAAEIAVITNSPTYFAGPSRPLLLTGEQSYSRIIRGYEEAGKKGIRAVFGHVTGIDLENKRVRLS